MFSVDASAALQSSRCEAADYRSNSEIANQPRDHAARHGDSTRVGAGASQAAGVGGCLRLVPRRPEAHQVGLEPEAVLPAADQGQASTLPGRQHHWKTLIRQAQGSYSFFFLILNDEM